MTQSEYSELATLLKLGISDATLGNKLSQALTSKLEELCGIPAACNIEFLEQLLGPSNQAFY